MNLVLLQNKIETIFGQQLVFSKVASSQQEQGMNSTIPQLTDQLQIRRNMNTGAISTSFPFTFSRPNRWQGCPVRYKYAQ